MEKAGEFNSARTLRAENLSEALYREAADQLRTQLDSLAKQSHCLQVRRPPPGARACSACLGLLTRVGVG